MKLRFIPLILVLFLGCKSNNNDKHDKTEIGAKTFAWRKPVLFTSSVASGISPDSLTLSVMFDNAIYRVRKGQYDTAFNFG